MNLESYVGQYTFADILAIEESDRQFIALQQSWSQVSALGMTQELFVYLVVQCALISFQVAGSGPDRWEEFGRKVVSDCATLMSLGHDNVDWRYDFLTHSRYNKRLYNIKRKRLEKFVNWYSLIVADRGLLDYHDDMTHLCAKLAHGMQQTVSSKTITLAVKMFGYAARIVTGRFVVYPMDVQIPVDSRLRQIYVYNKQKNPDEKKIQDYFQGLAEQFKVPPLHLDSLVWIDYREKIKN